MTRFVGWGLRLGTIAPSLSYVQRIATAQHNAAATTTVLTVVKATAAGSVVVLSAGSSSTGSTITSITDSRGNTWTVVGSTTNGTAVRCSVATTPASTPLRVGDTITVTWSGSVTTAGIAVDEFRGVVATPDGTGTGVNDSAGAIDITGTLDDATTVATTLLSVVAFTGSTTTATSGDDTTLAAVASAAVSGNRGSVLGYRNVTAAVTPSTTFTLDASHTAAMVLVALPSTGTPTPSDPGDGTFTETYGDLF